MSQSSIARMENQDINLSLAAEILSEGNASIFPGVELVSEQFYPGDAELIIGWKETVADQWPMLRAALELYTWPTNMDQGTKGLFVKDPTINGTNHPGKWRQASVRRMKTERSGKITYWIVLTLRSGYATTLGSDEARFTDFTGEAATGTLAVTETWLTLDPSLTIALASTLSAITSVTDPIIEGVKKTGTFALSQVTGRLVEDKQTGIISRRLTQVTDITSGGTVTTSAALATALAALKNIETATNEILEPFNFATGEDDTESFVVKNLNPSDGNELACRTTITDADMLLAFMGIDSGYTYINRGWKQEENGTATFAVQFKMVEWNDWEGTDGSGIAYTFDDTGTVVQDPKQYSFDISTAHYVRYSDPTRNWEQRVRTWENINKADIEYAVANARGLNTDGTEIEYPSGSTRSWIDPLYHLVAAYPQNNKNGEVNIVQVSQKDFTEIELDYTYPTLKGDVVVRARDHESQASFKAAALLLGTSTNNSVSATKEQNDDLVGSTMIQRPSSGGAGSTDPGFDFHFRYTADKFKYYTQWQYCTYSAYKARAYLQYGDVKGSTGSRPKGSCPEDDWDKVGGHAGMRTGVQLLSSGLFVVRVVGGRDDKPPVEKDTTPGVSDG